MKQSKIYVVVTRTVTTHDSCLKQIASEASAVEEQKDLFFGSSLGMFIFIKKLMPLGSFSWTILGKT